MSCKPLPDRTTCDVLVVGAGIAGITVALEAARAGANVAITCAGPLFGGSSFYPGTWGLGLVGPQDAADEDDLIQTILSVGGGVATPELVQTFVHGILPAIDWLEHDVGVTLERPSAGHEDDTAYIPCFDHKHRLWRGITRGAFTTAAQREIKRLGITVLEQCELAHLAKNDCGTVCGAVLFSHRNSAFIDIDAHATVLAAGGTSGIVERRLTARDVTSSVHGIALDAGCTLTNIEFMQMMPGLVSPAYGLVFNEKTFRYVQFTKGTSTLPSDPRELADLLETRSGHGPFTARLGDEAVDLAIDAAGADGLPLTYAFPQRDIPEFVQTFSSWLQREHGIGATDTLRVAMFAHASNGGVRIESDTSTGVPGLFACGELTGGMHGADRIGGLSSANGLVFGRKAGVAAAAFARMQASMGSPAPEAETAHTPSRIWLGSVPVLADTSASTLTTRLQRTMSTYAMINRTESGLTTALDVVGELGNELRRAAHEAPPSATPRERMNGIRLQSQLKLAHAMLEAMLARRESLGSHFRADAPCRHAVY